MQHIASDRTEQGPVSQNSSAEQSSEPNQAGTEHNSDSAIGANSYILNRTNEPLKRTENHVYQTTGRFPETPFLPLPLASRIIGVPTSGTFQNKYLLSSTCFRAPVSNETEIVEKGTKSHKRKMISWAVQDYVRKKCSEYCFRCRCLWNSIWCPGKKKSLLCVHKAEHTNTWARCSQMAKKPPEHTQ